MRTITTIALATRLGRDADQRAIAARRPGGVERPSLAAGASRRADAINKEIASDDRVAELEALAASTQLAAPR